MVPPHPPAEPSSSAQLASPWSGLSLSLISCHALSAPSPRSSTEGSAAPRTLSSRSVHVLSPPFPHCFPAHTITRSLAGPTDPDHGIRTSCLPLKWPPLPPCRDERVLFLTSTALLPASATLPSAQFLGLVPPYPSGVSLQVPHPHPKVPKQPSPSVVHSSFLTHVSPPFQVTNHLVCREFGNTGNQITILLITKVVKGLEGH